MSEIPLPNIHTSIRDPVNLSAELTGRVPSSGGFNYDSKVWGANDVRLSPSHLNALRLKYCLNDLKGIKGKLLEVGCGAGGMSKAIKFYRPDLEVHGMDISETAIHEAKVRSSVVNFTVGDTYHLAYPSEYFSAIVLFDVLEHLEFPNKVVDEIYRVLKPGGLVHLFVPCEGSLHTLHGILVRLGWRAKRYYGGHIQLFTETNVRELMQSRRFKVKNGRWSGHLINQVVDLLYFSFLALRGCNVPSSVESYLIKAKPSMWTRTIQVVKNAIAWLSFLESSVWRNIPGWGIHLACYKGQEGLSHEKG